MKPDQGTGRMVRWAVSVPLVLAAVFNVPAAAHGQVEVTGGSRLPMSRLLRGHG